MNTPITLENFVKSFNETEKNIRNHIQYHYGFHIRPLTQYASNAKGDVTYVSDSSCISYFLLKSNVFNQIDEKNAVELIQFNLDSLSEKRQKQLFSFLYQNHKNILFKQVEHISTYEAEKYIKAYPFEEMSNDDYVLFMDKCLGKLESSLNQSTLKQEFLKAINRKKLNQQDFLEKYPKLKTGELTEFKLTEEVTTQILNIRLDLKKLFLINLQKSFGYGKFTEVMESFFKQFKNSPKILNMDTVIIEFQPQTDTEHFMNIIFCAKEMNKKLIHETINLHLDEILKQSKLNLAQEKIKYNPNFYEKALIELSLKSSNEETSLKKPQRHKI